MEMATDQNARPGDVVAVDHRAILDVHQNAAVESASNEQRPIRLVVRDDDLRRSRLTVFFRFFLAIPHLVWVTLWGIAASVVAFILWLAVLIEAKAPESLHDFVAGYVRYATHVSAYLFIAANPYPDFRGAPGYPIDVEIDPPVRQSRWTGFFRLILALPALLLGGALGSGFALGGSGGMAYGVALLVGGAGVGAAAAFLAWFVAVARGRTSRGLRDLTAFVLGYGAEAAGYFMLLTPRYPSSDPALAEPYARLPHHPVRIVVTDDLGRPRLTTFFRWLLAIPHLLWLTLWSVLAMLAVIAAWFAALVIGRVPSTLHRFLAAFVRYSVHVSSFLYVIGRRFPGFTGRAGSYGVDIEIDPPERQRRLSILFRVWLAIPALLLSGTLSGVVLFVAFLGWWYALFRGRMPEGLRNLGAACLRYSAQATSYLFLLTDRYPYAAPILVEAPERTELPAPVVGDAF